MSSQELSTNNEQPRHALISLHTLDRKRHHRRLVLGNNDARFTGSVVKDLRIRRLPKTYIMDPQNIKLHSKAHEPGEQRPRQICVQQQANSHAGRA